MKKVIICLFFILSLFNLSAEKFESGETLKLSLTVTNVVYVGLTDSVLKSAVLPSSSKKDIGFTFNSATGKWVSEDSYIYVISYITDGISLSLTPPSLLYKVASETTDGNGNVTTTYDTTGLSYSLTVEAAGYTDNAASYVESPTVTSGSSNDVVLYKEETEKSYTESRAASWRLSVVLDPPEDTTTYDSGVKYQGVFTLTIKAVQ